MLQTRKTVAARGWHAERAFEHFPQLGFGSEHDGEGDLGRDRLAVRRRNSRP